MARWLIAVASDTKVASNMVEAIHEANLTKRQRIWRKHKVREKQIELLNELSNAHKHVRPVELDALRGETDIGRYLQVLEELAALAPSMLEASCRPITWSQIAPRLPGAQTPLFP